eukprot:TRINITY_DN12681_c1_g1_i1.p1 TRINITY_DN12681_c1_g1~~TRINITY_DN12681_c1_g1_i1.p1  ORF type:complete len:135 (-),score=17.02 TRINITY_DN12681_c1_g1_i1:138-542(-)
MKLSPLVVVCTLLASFSSGESAHYVELNHHETQRCSVDLKDKAPPGDYDFTYVCDTMPGGWYHYDGTTWAPATAGSGGCHIYKFMKGPKPDCTVNNSCNACENPTGTVIKEFYLVKDGCEMPSSCAGKPPAAAR